MVFKSYDTKIISRIMASDTVRIYRWLQEFSRNRFKVFHPLLNRRDDRDFGHDVGIGRNGRRFGNFAAVENQKS